jgi:hypothetical protein
VPVSFSEVPTNVSPAAGGPLCPTPGCRVRGKKFGSKWNAVAVGVAERA